jgi:hypothetical protein
MKRHGTRSCFRSSYPANVKLEYHTDGKEETFLKWLKEVRHRGHSTLQDRHLFIWYQYLSCRRWQPGDA